jgi:hypothetical protein
MTRRILIVPVLLLAAACQPQRPPSTATPAPPHGSIDLPAADAAHRYDSALKPIDETRAPRTVTAVRPVASARPPADALTEREKQAIARWDREEAALNNDAPPLGLRPPPRTRVALNMPTDSSLPRPTPERVAPMVRNDAALPPPVERPELAASAEPAKAGVAAVPPPPAPPPPVTPPLAARPEPPVAAPPAAPPADSGPPQQIAAAAPVTPPPAARAAAAVDTAIPRPSGEPAAIVTFSPRSADLSAGDRLLLEHFAKDANTRRVRLILLYGYAGVGNPVEARKVALARVLAVHACLIDLGLRANIEIGDFSQSGDAASDRVDVMLRH